VTVTGVVNLSSCLRNTGEWGVGYAQQKSKISKRKAKMKRRRLRVAGIIFAGRKEGENERKNELGVGGLLQLFERPQEGEARQRGRW